VVFFIAENFKKLASKQNSAKILNEWFAGGWRLEANFEVSPTGKLASNTMEGYCVFKISLQPPVNQLHAEFCLEAKK